ncbi:hypothetical protein NCCP2222_37880 [Sporosarcina sp. NCCP-2222]|nr:hypothetical protein NCCP2222_37880 [Sporosarcina sp. NCCP-2222]
MAILVGMYTSFTTSSANTVEFFYKEVQCPTMSVRPISLQ